MQRNILSLALGASMIGAAALAACSGGGGSSTTPGLSGSSSPAMPNTTTTTTTNGSTGLELVLTVPRPSTQTTAAQRAVLGSRKPAYVSSGAKGLQVAVSSGSTAKTVYADISSGSALCTNSSPTATCTIAVPTVGTSENIIATEVDQTPTGDTNGYGTGFPTTSNVLAVGTTSATTTAGTSTTVTLGLSPVWEQTFALAFSSMPTSQTDDAAFSPALAGWDGTTDRLTITAGAHSAYFADYVEDASGNNYDVDPTPLPFVDVNGSPEPITVTSNSSDVEFAALKNPAFPTPAPSFGLTASAPNDNYLWFNECIVFGVQTTSSFVPPATASVVLSNNLQATSPFSGSIYAAPPTPEAITAVPVNVTPTTATVHVSSSNGSTTATVTGSDYGATSGMGAFGSVATPTARHQNPDANPGECLDTSTSAEDASVASNGAIDTTSWTQSFTVTAIAAGTCTFALGDIQSGTISQLVTVTVDP